MDNTADVCTGDSHAALKASSVRWHELPLIGVQSDFEGGFFELRNCTACRSTLMVEVESALTVREAA